MSDGEEARLPCISGIPSLSGPAEAGSDLGALRDVLERLREFKTREDGFWLIPEQACYEWTRESLAPLAAAIQRPSQDPEPEVILLEIITEVLDVLRSFLERSALQPRKLFLIMVEELLRPLSEVSLALQWMEDRIQGQLPPPDRASLEIPAVPAVSQQAVERSAKLLRSSLRLGLFHSEEHILGLHSLMKEFLPRDRRKSGSRTGDERLRCWEASAQCEECSGIRSHSKASYHIRLFQTVHDLIQGHGEGSSRMRGHLFGYAGQYTRFLPVLYESLREQIQEVRGPVSGEQLRQKHQQSTRRSQKIAVIEDRLLVAVYQSFEIELRRRIPDLRARADAPFRVRLSQARAKRPRSSPAAREPAPPTSIPIVDDDDSDDGEGHVEAITQAALQLQVLSRLFRLVQGTGVYHPNHDTHEQTLPHQLGQSFRSVAAGVLCPLIQILLRTIFIRISPVSSPNVVESTLFAASAAFHTIHSYIMLGPHLLQRADSEGQHFNLVSLQIGGDDRRVYRASLSLIEASWLLLWLCSGLRDRVSDSPDVSFAGGLPKVGRKRKARPSEEQDSDSHLIQLKSVWRCISASESSYFEDLFEIYGAIGRLGVILEEFSRGLGRMTDMMSQVQLEHVWEEVVIQARVPWSAGPQPPVSVELIQTLRPYLKGRTSFGGDTRSPFLAALAEHVTPTSAAAIWGILLDAMEQGPTWVELATRGEKGDGPVSPGTRVWIRSQLPVLCQILGHWLSKVAITEHNVSELLPLFRRTVKAADIIRRTCLSLEPSFHPAFFGLQVCIQNFDLRCARFSRNPYQSRIVAAERTEDLLDRVEPLSWEVLETFFMAALRQVEEGDPAGGVAAATAWDFVWTMSQLVWLRLQQIHSESFHSRPKKEGKRLAVALLQDLPLCLRCSCHSLPKDRRQTMTLFSHYRNWKLSLLADHVSVWRPYCGSRYRRRFATLLCSSGCSRADDDQIHCFSDSGRLFSVLDTGVPDGGRELLTAAARSPQQAHRVGGRETLQDLDLLQTTIRCRRSATELAEDGVFVKTLLAAAFECGIPLFPFLEADARGKLKTVSELLWELEKTKRHGRIAETVITIASDLLSTTDLSDRGLMGEWRTKGKDLRSPRRRLAVLCDRFSRLPIHAAMGDSSSLGVRGLEERARLLCVQLWIQISDLHLSAYTAAGNAAEILSRSRLQVRNALLRLLAGLTARESTSLLPSAGFLFTQPWIAFLLSPGRAEVVAPGGEGVDSLVGGRRGVSPTSLALDFLFAWGQQEASSILNGSTAPSQERIQICDLLCDRLQADPDDVLARLAQISVLGGILSSLERLEESFRRQATKGERGEERLRPRFRIPKSIWRYFLILDGWTASALSSSRLPSESSSSSILRHLPSAEVFLCSRLVLRFRGLLASRFCAGLAPSTDPRFQKLVSVDSSVDLLNLAAVVLAQSVQTGRSSPGVSQAALLFLEDFAKSSIHLPLLLQQLARKEKRHQQQPNRSSPGGAPGILLRIGVLLSECARKTSPFHPRLQHLREAVADRLLFLRSIRVMTRFHELLSPGDLGELFRGCVSQLSHLAVAAATEPPHPTPGVVELWRSLFSLTQVLRSLLEAYSRRAHQVQHRREEGDEEETTAVVVLFGEREVWLLLDALLCVQSFLSSSRQHPQLRWLRDQIRRCMFSVVVTVLGKRHAFQLPSSGISRVLSLALSSIGGTGRRSDLQVRPPSSSSSLPQEAPPLVLSLTEEEGELSGNPGQPSNLEEAMTRFMGLARSLYAVIKYRPAALSSTLPLLVRLLRILISSVCCQQQQEQVEEAEERFSSPDHPSSSSDEEEFGSLLLRHAEIAPRVFILAYPTKYRQRRQPTLQQRRGGGGLTADALCLTRADFLSRILEELTKPSHTLLVCKHTPQILAEFLLLVAGTTTATARAGICEHVCQERLLPGIFSALRMCEHSKQMDTLRGLLSADEVALMALERLSEQWKRWGKYKGV